MYFKEREGKFLNLYDIVNMKRLSSRESLYKNYKRAKEEKKAEQIKF